MSTKAHRRAAPSRRTTPSPRPSRTNASAESEMGAEDESPVDAAALREKPAAPRRSTARRKQGST
jgi:hypothetical protein